MCRKISINLVQVGGIGDLDGAESVENAGLGVNARLRLGEKVGRDGGWCKREELRRFDSQQAGTWV